jgi:HEAT repeat protein
VGDGESGKDLHPMATNITTRRISSKLLWRLLLAAFVVVALAILFSKRQPRFEGRSLSGWFNQAAEGGGFRSLSPGPATAAFAHFGSQAQPFLLSWAGRHPPLSAKVYDRWLVNLPRWMRPPGLHSQQWYVDRRYLALWLLRFLEEWDRMQPAGSPGVPRDAGTNALPVLLTTLGDDDPTCRFLAVRAIHRLGERGSPAVPHLMGLLDDPDLRVSVGALDALARVGARTSNVVEFLSSIATDRTNRLRGVAIETLGEMGPAAGRAAPALAALLNEQSSAPTQPVPRNPGARVRNSGQQARDCQRIVRQLAELQAPIVRKLAAKRAPAAVKVSSSPATLGDPGPELGPPAHMDDASTASVTGTVSASFSSKQSRVLAPTSPRSLSSRQPATLVPSLPWTQSGSPEEVPDASEIRSLAAEALAKIGAALDDVSSQIRQEPGSEDDTTRTALAVAVWRSDRDNPARQAMVIEALRSSDWGVRLRATRLLSDLGTNAAVFLPELRRLLLDPESVVRLCAMTAVRRVSPPEP